MVDKAYKPSDYGVIPAEWQIGVLGDNIDEMTDYVAAGSFEALRNNVKTYDTPHYALYVRLVDLRAGLGHASQKYVDEPSYRFLSKSNLYGNEVLMANIGANVGETVLMPATRMPATLAPNMILIRSNADKLSRDFLYYYTKSRFGKDRLSELVAGSGHPKVSKTDLKRYVVLIPPLPEQEAIATVLSDVDALIASLDTLIAKKRDIKQAAIQQLLTGNVRLPGFRKALAKYRQTEVGVIPVDWNTEMLESVSAPDGLVRGPFGGTLKKEFFVRDGFKVYEQRNAIYRNADLGSYYIDERKYKELGRFAVKAGDFIVSCSGTIGRIFQIPEGARDGVINQALLKIETNPAVVDDRFFFCVFDWDRFQRSIVENTHGGAMQNLVGMAIFRTIPIPLPPLPEQQAIATILSDMDAEIAALERRRDKTLALKQGMMQELLTGRIRLR